MNSIPAAMTWEMLYRGRWYLLLGLLGGIAFPSIIVFALSRDGALNPSEPITLMISLELMLVSGMFFGAAVFGVQTAIAHLYAYPIRTASLVAWRLIPGMALMALQMALCISFLNVLFHLEWPVLGPAMAMAVMLAAFQSAAWLTEKSLGWAIVALGVAAAICGIWYRSRYGPPLLSPTHDWTNLTPTDVLAMAAMAGVAFGVAVFAVGRNRRGESPLSVGFWQWFGSLFSNAGDAERPLHSPMQAQLWVEWTRKGWIMPIGVLLVIAVSFVGWLFSSGTTVDLFTGFFTGGYLLPLFGFVGGLALGNIGPNDANYAMGHFMATRPISNAELGQVILRTGIKSVLFAWAIWAACFALTSVYLWSTGVLGAMKLPPDFHWAYFPATILAPWAFTSSLMSLSLAGRTRYVVQLVSLVPAAIILFTVVGQMFLSREVEALVARILTSVVCVALILGAGSAFVAARRRKLIHSGTIWAAATVWVAALAFSFFEMPSSAQPLWLAYFLLAAFMAWVVGPFAAVPLALSWNRHR
jgi:hypothetical protein